MKLRRLSQAKTVLLAGVVAALVVPLSALGGTTSRAAAKSAALEQRQANYWQVDQVEVKFHRATSTHNIKLMMSLWAPGSIFDIDQQTLVGKSQIKHWFLTQNKAFMPQDHWQSDTPSYKIKIHLEGNQATLYFECDYINPKTDAVVASAGVTHTLQKINGKWLITNSTGSTAVPSA